MTAISTWTKLGLVPLVAFLLSACGYDGPKVTISELETAIEDSTKSVLVVDVRPRSLYEKGHVPGAVNIPLGEIGERAEELSRRRGEVAIMCNCGRMALEALKVLSEKNVTAALVVGGFKAWTAAGYPVEKGSSLPHGSPRGGSR